jgi:hypothetical protein
MYYRPQFHCLWFGEIAARMEAGLIIGYLEYIGQDISMHDTGVNGIDWHSERWLECLGICDQVGVFQ